MLRIFYLLLTYVCYVLTQTTTNELKIDVQENGKLDVDEEMAYYMLRIPKKIEKNKKNLLIRIKESDSADIGEEDFSDPDIYVSKVNTICKIFFRLIKIQNLP